MKKLIRSTIPAFLIVSILLGTLLPVQAADVTPRYIGIASITSRLTISDTGKASCSGKAMLWDDYSADITVELKRDGVTIKTWTSSGSVMASASGTYYVTSGHTYIVTTYVTVYTADGRFVESHFKDSLPTDY